MRLNPRQRWEADRTSNIAGIPALVLAEYASIMPCQIMKPIDRAPDEKAFYEAEDREYKNTLAEINGAIVRGLAEIFGHHNTDWVELGRIKMRCGRNNEITIVAQNYSDFRSWLTNVSLALFDRYPLHTSFGQWSENDKKLRHVLDMLDKSSDRRPFNQYTYRDISCRELDRFAIRRRLENVKSDRKFRHSINEMFAEMRMKKEGSDQ